MVPGTIAFLPVFISVLTVSAKRKLKWHMNEDHVETVMNVLIVSVKQM